MKRNLMIVLGAALATCACTAKKNDNNNNNDYNQRRQKGNCCETEKAMTPPVSAPQTTVAPAPAQATPAPAQASPGTIAKPELKAEKQ